MEGAAGGEGVVEEAGGEGVGVEGAEVDGVVVVAGGDGVEEGEDGVVGKEAGGGDGGEGVAEARGFPKGVTDHCS